MSKVISFFREVVAEFHHISWPKRESLIQSTIVVISISIIVSLILGGFDYIFTNTIGYLTQLKSNQNQVIQPIAIPTIIASPSGETKK